MAVASVLVLLLGLHWTVLQTVAWTRMLLDYSRSAPLRTAVAMTFDGRHPCALCQVIKQGRESEQKQPVSVSKTGVKLECDLPADTVEITPAACPAPSRAWAGGWSSRDDAPPKPRPRLGLAA